MIRLAHSLTFITLLIILLVTAFGTDLVGARCVPLVGAAGLPPIDWTHYHGYSEIVSILLALNETYPNVVDVFSIGKSWQNRDIYCVRLTNESDSSLKPEAFFVGYHHAREPITAELTLYFVVWAATNFGSNTTITKILNRSETYVVVALNVDGFGLFNLNDNQRKNARPIDEDHDGRVDEDPPEDENGDGFIEQLSNFSDPGNPVFIRWEGSDNDGDAAYAEDWVGGVDLNRNYDYKWQYGDTNPRSETYRGTAPFSEPETRAVGDLVSAHNFTYAISFHSGAEVILYPWGYTHLQCEDHEKFVEIAQDLSSITGWTLYEQSSDLYYTYGLWDDWMYGAKNVLALTCEIFGNDTWEGVTRPGQYPNTKWEGGLRYWFNPFPSGIQSIIQRWLPVFFNIAERTVADIAIDKIELGKTIVSQGYTIKVNISVQNKGLFPEKFNVSIHANAVEIGRQAVTLPEESAATISFIWNIGTTSRGNYTISAHAWPVVGEISTDDNFLVAASVTVARPGDVNADGKVDLKDVYAVGRAYGSRAGEPRYNPNLDIWDDGKIDLKDYYIVCGNYGKTGP